MTPLDRTAADSIMATLRQIEAIAYAARHVIGPADQEQTAEEICVEELLRAIEDLCEGAQRAALAARTEAAQ